VLGSSNIVPDHLPRLVQPGRCVRGVQTKRSRLQAGCAQIWRRLKPAAQHRGRRHPMAARRVVEARMMRGRWEDRSAALDELARATCLASFGRGCGAPNRTSCQGPRRDGASCPAWQPNWYDRSRHVGGRLGRRSSSARAGVVVFWLVAWGGARWSGLSSAAPVGAASKASARLKRGSRTTLSTYDNTITTVGSAVPDAQLLHYAVLIIRVI